MVNENIKPDLKFKAKQLRNEVNSKTNKPYSYREIASELGIGIETARRYVNDISQRTKTKPVIDTRPAAELIEEDYNTLKLKAQAQTNLRKYNELLKKHQELELRNEILLSIKDKPSNILKINPSLGASKNEAVAIALASDWHLEERVDPKTINDLNEFNPDIAKFRAINYFVNLLKIIKKERQDVIIDKLILWLGGDLITGYIHDEFIEENYMSPTEAILFAQEIFYSGIDFLVNHGDFKEIIIPCSFGNHGRTNVKKKVSSSYKNSYEWLMYHTLSQFFENEDRVKFKIVNSYFNYIDIYGKTLRFSHGDYINYHGGLGGIQASLNKHIYRANTQTHADLNLMGHFHQLTHGSDFIVNGSLIGFNAYAQSIGASPERPQQAFQLLDSKRGFTISAPILVTDGDGKY